MAVRRMHPMAQSLKILKHDAGGHKKALNFAESHEFVAFAFVLSAGNFLLASGIYSIYIVIAQMDLSEIIQTHHKITTRDCVDL